MKFLRILLILLVPAVGIVSCKKSEAKPNGHCTHESTTAVAPAEPVVEQNNAQGRFAITPDEETDGSTVIGSGDDDREGGGKKKKTK